MKKIFTILLLSLLTGVIGSYAQESSNRVLVREKVTGNITGFIADRIDSIFFAEVEGPVKAEISDVTVDEAEETITMAITRTDNCDGFKICVVNSRYAAYLDDPIRAAYMVNQLTNNIYYQDFTEAVLSGMEPFKADTDYYIVTLGFDYWGVACGVDVYSFHTAKPEIVGNPDVAYTIDEITGTSVTITFTPNEDVSCYYYCLFQEGQLMDQFNMWGPFMGYTSPQEMVAGFGWYDIVGKNTNTWDDDIMPGTKYEVYVAMRDVNGQLAENMVCIPFTTPANGGDGLAEISITIGDGFWAEEENKYAQMVTFTPNSEVNFYRAAIFEKATWQTEGKDEEDIKEYLMSDPYMGMLPSWNIYGEDSDYWALAPNTEYWAAAIGQNGNGEWGELSIVEFSTPVVDGVEAAPAKKISIRLNSAKGTNHNVMAPAIPTGARSTKGLQLIEK